MKKIFYALFAALLFVQPAMQLNAVVEENFGDFEIEEAGEEVSRGMELVKEGLEYSAMFAIGFIGYLVLYGVSPVVRKKTNSAVEHVMRRVRRVVSADDKEPA